jgi:hypothetical protein
MPSHPNAHLGAAGRTSIARLSPEEVAADLERAELLLT